MHADLKGALIQINKSWRAFKHRGKSMTKIQVKAVLEYGIRKGYKTTNELSDEEVDAIINPRKSVHQIFEEAKEAGLDDNHIKEILVKEKIIITKQPSLFENDRNWVEDFSHENGNYSNICIRCNNEFLGHKRRIVCKNCSNK